MTDERDVQTHALLSMLDPDLADPGYWHRFHRWVVTAASPELARRRRAVQATVGDVMLSWWRALVPTALAAALVAGALLLSEEQSPAPVAYVDMDEMLVVGVEAPAMPSFETTAPDGAIELVNEVY